MKLKIMMCECEDEEWDYYIWGDLENEEWDYKFYIPFGCYNDHCTLQTDCFFKWIQECESKGRPWVGTLVMFAGFGEKGVISPSKVYFNKEERKIVFKERLHIALSEGSAELIYSLGKKNLFGNLNVETLKCLVDVYEADLERRDCEGRSVLHCAAVNGWVEMVEYITEETRGEIINDDKDKVLGVTPLHSAARGGHFDVVKHLLEKGAEVNGKGGETPLHLACSYVKVIRDQDGKKSLDLRIIKELLKKEPDLIKEGAKYGKYTPFHYFFECQQESYTEKEISGPLCFWSLILEGIGLIENSVIYTIFKYL